MQRGLVVSLCCFPPNRLARQEQPHGSVVPTILIFTTHETYAMQTWQLAVRWIAKV